MYHRIKENIVPITKCLLLLFWLSSFYTFRDLTGVSASQIQKTHVLTADDPEPIVLDCDYDVDHYNSTLVVKWIKDGKAIYQWIKGHKPTVYPHAKGSIDEEFEQSSEPNYRYRAISFPNPTKELSGVYKCLVETMNNTRLIQTHLQVIDISNTNIELESTTLSNETQVTCAVENVYPEPRLSLWTNDDITLSTISEKIGPQYNGLYNATIVVSASQMDADEEVGCTLHFPGVEFNVTKILKSSTSTKKTTVVGLLFMLLLVISA